MINSGLMLEIEVNCLDEMCKSLYNRHLSPSRLFSALHKMKASKWIIFSGGDSVFFSFTRNNFLGCGVQLCAYRVCQ